MSKSFDPNKIYVLEWSNSQECFHIHTLQECIDQNLQSIANHWEHLPDYLPIAVSDSDKFFESDDECDKLRQHLLNGRNPKP